MHKIFMAALAAAAIVSGLGSQTEAMTPAAALAATAADAALLQQAVAVCGINGCVKVQVAPPRKRLPHNHRP